MEKSDIKKRLIFKKGDVVIDNRYNLLKIHTIKFEKLKFNPEGAGWKPGQEVASIIWMPYADVTAIRKTPYANSGTVTRLLGSDFWNTDHYTKISLKDGINKCRAARILYGCK